MLLVMMCLGKCTDTLKMPISKIVILVGGWGRGFGFCRSGLSIFETVVFYMSQIRHVITETLRD